MTYSEISLDDLMDRVGAANAPMIVDLRIEEDREAIPYRLPGSVLVDHEAVPHAVPEAQECVVLCHKGLKISHGAAALLSGAGRRVSVAQGGIVAWKDAGGPLVRAGVGTRWVTDDAFSPARLLAIWLIRRFVARDAEILRVPGDHIEGVTQKFSAAAFAEKGSEIRELCRDLELDWAPLKAVEASLGRLDGPTLDGLRALHGTDPEGAANAMCGLGDLWLAAARGAAA